MHLVHAALQGGRSVSFVFERFQRLLARLSGLIVNHEVLLLLAVSLVAIALTILTSITNLTSPSCPPFATRSIYTEA